MAMQPAICSNCGGRINVDDVDLNGFAECEYCFTSHKIIDIITIDGLPTAKSYLMVANQAINDKLLEKAVEYYNKVIEIKPNCHEAWWGLYICQNAFDEYYGYEDKYGNTGILTKASIMHDTLKRYAYRAIEYAPFEASQGYKLEIQQKESFIQSVINGDFDKKVDKQSCCYIATCVYGSYTCEEVMQLRRFRDDCLSKKVLGRLFIRVYYFISPCLVKYIKRNSFVNTNIKKILDWVRMKI